MSTRDAIASCRTCGEPLESGWDRCPSCLNPTAAGEFTCSSCGKEIKPKWKRCPYCKAALGGFAVPTGEIDSVTGGEVENEARIGLTLGMDFAGDAGVGFDVPLELGDVLVERYTIQKLLGSGSVGAVYLAHDSVLGKEVALKIVKAGEGAARSAADQLLHEFQLRERIEDASHVIKAYDPRRAEYKNLPVVLLPMEFAGAGSLRSWLDNHPNVGKRLPEGLNLFIQSCQGIKAIHDAGLIHLDLKPENILLVDGKAKITDFGIGRFCASHFEDNPSRLLRQGVGTPQYMSPEQFKSARQKDIGLTSDVYSLGVMLYELLDGNPPFDGTPIELRDKHLNVTPSPLTGSGERWWRIVGKCLAKKPEDRYQDVDQLAADLQRAKTGDSLLIDAGCPGCGHLNANASAKECERCRTDLSSLFRLCPVCAREVRMDIEACPGCGKQVAAYYLLLERKKRIDRLKDEDPVEAIELLETVLREGAEDYQEQAVALVKQLREKQAQISGLIHQAEQDQSAGDFNKALENWETILRIIPRHRIALKKQTEIQSAITEIQRQLKRACELADQGFFPDAESLLRKCLERNPDHPKAKKLLCSFLDRARDFSAAFEAVDASVKEKRMRLARKQVETALTAAPKHQKTLELKKKIFNTISSTSDLLKRAQEQLQCAEYVEVQRCLAKIENQQADENLDRVKEQLDENRRAFDEGIMNAESAIARKMIYDARADLERVLAVAPKSRRALAMQQLITQIIETTASLLDDAEDYRSAADFEEADDCIKAIEEKQLDENAVNELRKEIVETGQAYLANMEEADAAFDELDLVRELRFLDQALENCPDSEWANERREKNQRMRELVNRLLDAVKQALDQARFTEINEWLREAESTWRHCEAIESLKEKTTSAEEKYSAEINRANVLLKKKKFDSAREACAAALSICPSAQDAMELSSKILTTQSAYEERRRQRWEFFWSCANEWKYGVLGFVLVLVAVIGVILGFRNGVLGVEFLKEWSFNSTWSYVKSFFNFGAMKEWIFQTGWPFLLKLSGYDLITSWVSLTAWPYLMGHNALLLFVAAGILFLCAMIHRLRFTNLFVMFFSMTNRTTNDFDTATIMVAGAIGVLFGGMAAGLSWIARIYIAFTIDECITLGLLIWDVFLAAAFVYSFSAKKEYILR